MERQPPERIELDSVGVVLRRHRLDDIDQLHAVIEESRDHLRPFMPWADQARDETAAFVAKAVQSWEAGAELNFLVTSPDASDAAAEQILGGCGVHDRGDPGVREIGYWLRPDATGRGVMTAAAGRLTDLALTTAGIERVEIRCDEANARSAAVARRLGYVLSRIDDRTVTAPGEHGRQMVWVRRPGAPEP